MKTQDLISALTNPAFYPHPTNSTIQVMQTQMSLVFLTGEFVYKIKKPVNLGYVDYTTLENRKYFCDQEVVLNRRLSPNVYLEVLPITLESNNSLQFQGSGEIVEYAVKMRYLPQDRMLNELLPKNKVTPEMMKGVAHLIANFHKKAESNEEISKIASLETQTYNAEENFAQLSPYIGRVLTNEQHSRIATFARNYLSQYADVFNRRNREGKIKDCHGDLHSQHICFTDPIAIYDCIEFTNRFRCIDIAAEVSFLCMDLDHAGYGDLAQVFLKEYVKETQDPEIISLSRYYKAYYACVRAKVNCFQLDDPLVSDETKSKCMKTAQEYLNLADSNSLARPAIFINCGTSACGKTTFSKELTKHMGLYYISSDITRKQLNNIPVTEHNYAEYNKGLYSQEMTELTYNTMFEKAQDALKMNYSVVLDAAFLKYSERKDVLNLAKENNVDYYILHHIIDDETTRKNMQERAITGTVSDATYDIYLNQVKFFEPITSDEKSYVINLDAKQSVNEKIKIVMEEINHD